MENPAEATLCHPNQILISPSDPSLSIQDEGWNHKHFFVDCAAWTGEIRLPSICPRYQGVSQAFQQSRKACRSNVHNRSHEAEGLTPAAGTGLWLS